MTTNSEPNLNPDSEDADDATKAPVASSSSDMSGASFWDESQIQQVIRHAGQTRRSPEEFFNKKWKDKLIHKKSEGDPASDEETS